MKRILVLARGLFGSSWQGVAALIRPPNIVYILADDLGLGDLWGAKAMLLTAPRYAKTNTRRLRFLTRSRPGIDICAPLNTIASANFMPDAVHSDRIPSRG
jgi:hypothetical protein